MANHGFEALEGLTVTAKVLNEKGNPVNELKASLMAAPSAVTEAMIIPPLKYDKLLSFVRLELRNRTGELLSSNFYWRAGEKEMRMMNDLPKVKLEASAELTQKKGASI